MTLCRPLTKQRHCRVTMPPTEGKVHFHCIQCFTSAQFCKVCPSINTAAVPVEAAQFCRLTNTVCGLLFCSQGWLGECLRNRYLGSGCQMEYNSIALLKTKEYQFAPGEDLALGIQKMSPKAAPFKRLDINVHVFLTT